MRVIVSDTAPVRALAGLSVLDVVPQLFERVLIPPAVVRELASPPAGLPVVMVDQFAFVDVRSPANPARIAELRHDLRFFISAELYDSVLRLADE